MTSRPGYWLGLAVAGVGLEAVALYYQYALHYGPCVLCIHVRMGIAGIIVTALVALGLRRLRPARIAAQAIVVLFLAWLTERAWRLLSTERGWEIGSCEMVSGLPSWFALDRWIPWLFGIVEPCGYTPVMPWGATMAESLLVLFGAATLFGLWLLGASFRDTERGS